MKIIHSLKNSSILRFALVGSIGFVVDGSILYVLLPTLGYIDGRIISFLCAASLTWLLNRQFTFSASKSRLHTEWFRYLLANAIGASINFGCYLLLVLHIKRFHQFPIAALAIASISAMLFNYISSKFFVFQQQTEQTA